MPVQRRVSRSFNIEGRVNHVLATNLIRLTAATFPTTVGVGGYSSNTPNTLLWLDNFPVKYSKEASLMRARPPRRAPYPGPKAIVTWKLKAQLCRF